MPDKLENCWIRGDLSKQTVHHIVVTRECSYRKEEPTTEVIGADVDYFCTHPDMAKGAPLDSFCPGAQAAALKR